VIGAIGNGLI